MNALIIIFICVIIGGLLALQGVLNTQLASVLQQPLQAAFISFLVGGLAITCAALVTKQGLPSPKLVMSSPKVLLLGGLFGAMYITASILFIPKIGIASVVLAVLTGEVIASLLFDQYGILGIEKRAITIERIAGSALMLIGLFLFNREHF